MSLLTRNVLPRNTGKCQNKPNKLGTFIYYETFDTYLTYLRQKIIRNEGFGYNFSSHSFRLRSTDCMEKPIFLSSGATKYDPGTENKVSYLS